MIIKPPNVRMTREDFDVFVMVVTPIRMEQMGILCAKLDVLVKLCNIQEIN